MSIDHQIRAIAGSFILLSLLAARYVNPNWIYFTAFVGVNLIQSSFTHFCPMESILRKIQGKPRGGESC